MMDTTRQADLDPPSPFSLNVLAGLRRHKENDYANNSD
jgi:hypothetical protein